MSSLRMVSQELGLISRNPVVVLDIVVVDSYTLEVSSDWHVVYRASDPIETSYTRTDSGVFPFLDNVPVTAVAP